MTAESPANKGYGNSVTLPYDVTDTENAHHILLSLCETVGARIRYDKAYISVVQVQIVDNDFHHRCKQLSLPSATNVTEKIYEAACNAFDQGWDHAPIRLLGVSTSKATDESYEQYNLFDQDKFERLSKLNSAIDKIRDKYGMMQSCVPVLRIRTKIKLQHPQTGNYKGSHRNLLLREVPHVFPAQ